MQTFFSLTIFVNAVIWESRHAAIFIMYSTVLSHAYLCELALIVHKRCGRRTGDVQIQILLDDSALIMKVNKSAAAGPAVNLVMFYYSKNEEYKADVYFWPHLFLGMYYWVFVLVPGMRSGLDVCVPSPALYTSQNKSLRCACITLSLTYLSSSWHGLYESTVSILQWTDRLQRQINIIKKTQTASCETLAPGKVRQLWWGLIRSKYMDVPCHWSLITEVSKAREEFIKNVAITKSVYWHWKFIKTTGHGVIFVI